VEDLAPRHGQRLLPHVELQPRRPGHAGHAEAARDHRGVGGHAAPLGQDALGGVHAADILGAGLAPDEDTGLPLRRRGLRRGGGEHDPAGGGARGRGDPAGQHVAFGILGHLPVQKLVQRVRRDPAQRLVTVDHAFLGQRDGDGDRGPRRPGHAHGVEHLQLAVHQRELDLHLLAQALAHGVAIGPQGGDLFGRVILQRGAARSVSMNIASDRDSAARPCPCGR
jgi:hypothetical protein